MNLERSYLKLTLCLIVVVHLDCASRLAFGSEVDLVYDPVDGNVRVDTNGLNMVSFALENEPGGNDFITENTDFSDLPAALFAPTNTPTQIGWFAEDLSAGFVGVADLGNIFPVGLSELAVDEFTTIPDINPPQGRLYALGPVPPGGGGQMNLVYVTDPSRLPGDANLDGFVDELDFDIWLANIFTDSSEWTDGDFNQDGHVDASDFNIWNDNRTDIAAAVPEPAGGVLLLFGILACSRLQRPTLNSAESCA